MNISICLFFLRSQKTVLFFSFTKLVASTDFFPIVVTMFSHMPFIFDKSPLLSVLQATSSITIYMRTNLVKQNENKLSG